MAGLHRSTIESSWENRELLGKPETQKAIRDVISLLDKGKLRIAEPVAEGWIINEWIKKAIILYFLIQDMEVFNAGPLEFYDKIPLKKGFKALGVRVVPHAVARFGSFIAEGVILMPSYINIGAYIDHGSMVDTWATVGSCAQVGKNVHLSGGVGLGGVLEPIQAAPVIIEDGCFIGSRCIIVEGVRVGKEAVLGANVVLTSSTRIIDVSGSQPVEYKGTVPPRSVVIPGSFEKEFPAGKYQVSCALIIGQRKTSTNLNYDPIGDKCLNNKGQAYENGINDCDIWVEKVLGLAGIDISGLWGPASSTDVAGHVRILSEQLLSQAPAGWSIEIIDGSHVALVKVNGDGSADLYHQGNNRGTPTTEWWQGSRGYHYENAGSAYWGDSAPRFWGFDR